MDKVFPIRLRVMPLEQRFPAAKKENPRAQTR